MLVAYAVSRDFVAAVLSTDNLFVNDRLLRLVIFPVMLVIFFYFGLRFNDAVRRMTKVKVIQDYAKKLTTISPTGVVEIKSFGVAYRIERFAGSYQFNWWFDVKGGKLHEKSVGIWSKKVLVNGSYHVYDLTQVREALKEAHDAYKVHQRINQPSDQFVELFFPSR